MKIVNVKVYVSDWRIVTMKAREGLKSKTGQTVEESLEGNSGDSVYGKVI